MTTESRERERVSFQEVAKLATDPEPSSGSTDERKENSGMIDLSALAAGETSPQSTPGSSAPTSPLPPATMESERANDGPTRWIPAPVPTAPWLPHAGPPAASPSTAAHATPLLSERAAPSMVAAAAPSFPRPAPLPFETARPTSLEGELQARRGGAAVAIALAAGMALGALMVGAFFGMRSVYSAQASRLSAAASPLTAVLSATALSSDAKIATRPISDDRAADPAAVPQPPSDPPIAYAPAKRALPAAAVRSPNGAPAPSPGSGAAPSIQASPATPAPGTEQSLEALMKRAVGSGARPAPPLEPTPSAGAQATAPAAPQNVPVKPAVGAVQGALGTVLPAARYCLGPDDPVSRATITFQSDGSVQAVSVAGDASGQPAESCIRSRLMTTRVPPFSSPTFTWTVTVRPAS